MTRKIKLDEPVFAKAALKAAVAKEKTTRKTKVAKSTVALKPLHGSLAAAGLYYLIGWYPEVDTPQDHIIRDRDLEFAKSLAGWFQKNKSFTQGRHRYAQRLCWRNRKTLTAAGFDTAAINNEVFTPTKEQIKAAKPSVKVTGIFGGESDSGKAFKVSVPGFRPMWMPKAQCEILTQSSAKKPIQIGQQIEFKVPPWLAARTGLGA